MSLHPPIADWHPLDCGCATCEVYTATPRLRHASDRIGLLTLAGVAVGLALCAIVDLVTGNAGVLGMFGL